MFSQAAVAVPALREPRSKQVPLGVLHTGSGSVKFLKAAFKPALSLSQQ